MRDHHIEKLLDNLRMFTITGAEEYKQSARDMLDCLYRFDNSIVSRTKKILEQSGFRVTDEGIMTKHGPII